MEFIKSISLLVISMLYFYLYNTLKPQTLTLAMYLLTHFKHQYWWVFKVKIASFSTSSIKKYKGFHFLIGFSISINKLMHMLNGNIKGIDLTLKKKQLIEAIFKKAKYKLDPALIDEWFQQSSIEMELNGYTWWACRLNDVNYQNYVLNVINDNYKKRLVNYLLSSNSMSFKGGIFEGNKITKRIVNIILNEVKGEHYPESMNVDDKNIEKKTLEVKFFVPSFPDAYNLNDFSSSEVSVSNISESSSLTETMPHLQDYVPSMHLLNQIREFDNKISNYHEMVGEFEINESKMMILKNKIRMGETYEIVEIVEEKEVMNLEREKIIEQHEQSLKYILSKWESKEKFIGIEGYEFENEEGKMIFLKEQEKLWEEVLRRREAILQDMKEELEKNLKKCPPSKTEKIIKESRVLKTLVEEREELSKIEKRQNEIKHFKSDYLKLSEWEERRDSIKRKIENDKKMTEEINIKTIENHIKTIDILKKNKEANKMKRLNELVEKIKMKKLERKEKKMELFIKKKSIESKEVEEKLNEITDELKNQKKSLQEIVNDFELDVKVFLENVQEMTIYKTLYNNLTYKNFVKKFDLLKMIGKDIELVEQLFICTNRHCNFRTFCFKYLLHVNNIEKLRCKERKNIYRKAHGIPLKIVTNNLTLFLNKKGIHPYHLDRLNIKVKSSGSFRVYDG